MANHNEVAHAWANQTGRARKGFNMFYEGDTLYSYGYHFPIARIVNDGLILFTSKGYSVSTAKHKSYTRRAIDQHRYTVLTVQNVKPVGPQDHQDNLECLVRDASAALGRAKRARKYASVHLHDAQCAINTYNEYSATFAPGLPELTVESIDAAASDIMARAEQMRAEAELVRAKAARKRALRERDTLRGWLNGADVYPPHTRVPYVRVKGEAIETTWGASVPLSDALGLWGMMKHARAAHASREFLQHMIGDFRLTSVTPLGARVGCHYIPFKFAQLAACAAGID